MKFTQIIEVDGADEQALRDHIATWDAEESERAPGYLGARLFIDADRSGRHVLAVDFASVEQAEENNAREVTAGFAAKLRSLADEEPVYRNMHQVYST